MFVDASALVAILNREEGAAELDNRIRNLDRPVHYSDLVVFEATQAVARVRAFARSVSLRQNPDILVEALREVMLFLDGLGAVHIPITSEVGVEAIHASRRFGKVVGHAAALNLGDSYSYACAKVRNLGLLYKGLDFASTDLA